MKYLYCLSHPASNKRSLSTTRVSSACKLCRGHNLFIYLFTYLFVYSFIHSSIITLNQSAPVDSRKHAIRKEKSVGSNGLKASGAETANKAISPSIRRKVRRLKVRGLL